MPSPDHESSTRIRRLLWITGACVGAIALALLLGVGALQHLRQATELALLRRELQMAAIERRSLEIELESERLITREELAIALQSREGERNVLDGLVIALLRPASPGSPASAAVVCDPGRARGVLLLESLPPGSERGAYQLWHDDAPVEDARFEFPQESGPVRVPFVSRFTPGGAWELRTAPGPKTASTAVVLTSR